MVISILQLASYVERRSQFFIWSLLFLFLWLQILLCSQHSFHFPLMIECPSRALTKILIKVAHFPEGYFVADNEVFVVQQPRGRSLELLIEQVFALLNQSSSQASHRVDHHFSKTTIVNLQYSNLIQKNHPQMKCRNHCCCSHSLQVIDVPS